MTRMLAIVLVAISLAGCGTAGVTSSFCDPRSGINPIRLTAAERAALAITPKQNILAVNNYGRENCGWKP